MKNDTLLKVLLSAITALLATLIVQRMISPPLSHAQSSRASASFYIEPGTTTLRAPDGSRQVVGKVLIDLETGKVWGLPTIADLPYPMDGTKTTPPTSVPFLLAKYDFSVIK